MNKRQKEIQQQFLNNEKAVLKKLEANYRDALGEINSKIELLLLRQDADMQHVIYQVEYQRALKTQVQSILETLQTNEFATLSEYLTKSYEDGFIGTMYDLQGQGIPLIFPIDQKAVVDAIQHETKLSESLYTSLGHDMDNLRKKVSGEISRGLSSGQMYTEIARNVASWARVPKNNAMRIARTEAHRIQCKATMDACHKAKDKGADVVKQWDASLDKHTRDSHRDVDGEIREMDEPFSNGLMYPGDPSGRPEEVINCRCALLQRARWALGNDYTKWSPDAPVVVDDDGTTQFAIIEAKNYEDFQKYYKQASERVREDVQKMNDVEDYLQSKSAYDKEIERVHKLEKETDDLLDKYMEAMDTPDESRIEKLHSKKYEELESLREVVKDLKAQLSGKEAKAVRHIEKNLAIKTGIPIERIKMTGLQYDTAEMIYDSYDIVLKKFPELKGNLAKFTYDGVYGDAYASCATLTGEIQAHGIFAKYVDLVKLYADDVANGFHPIGTDHRSIIVHELGHALDGYMTKQRLLGADFNQYGIISTSSKTAKDMTLKMLGFDRQEIAIELKNQGLKTWDRSAILEQKEREFIAKHVSGYATGYDSDGNKSTTYPEHEFFAECFAEYIMSDNPREAAKVFGEIIEKALGR